MVKNSENQFFLIAGPSHLMERLVLILVAALLGSVIPSAALDAADGANETERVGSPSGRIALWGSFPLQEIDRMGPMWTALVINGQYRQVATKFGNVFAIRGGRSRNGSIAAWGPDEYGVVSDVPEGEFMKIVAGKLALDTDGRLHRWGLHPNRDYEPLPEGRFVDIASGYVSFALDENGQIHAWGNKESVFFRETPEGTFSAIAAHNQRAAAIDTEGRIHEWGRRPDRKGSGSMDPPDGVFRKIALASLYSVAIDENGSLHAWGLKHHDWNPIYQVPDGEFVEVAAGDDFCAAIDRDGRLHVWGLDNSSVVAGAPQGLRVLAVAGGISHCVVVLAPDEPLPWRP